MRSRVYDTITWNAKSSHDKNNASSIYNTELKNINPWKQPDKKKNQPAQQIHYIQNTLNTLNTLNKGYKKYKKHKEHNTKIETQNTTETTHSRKLRDNTCKKIQEKK